MFAKIICFFIGHSDLLRRGDTARVLRGECTCMRCHKTYYKQGW